MKTESPMERLIAEYDQSVESLRRLTEALRADPDAGKNWQRQHYRLMNIAFKPGREHLLDIMIKMELATADEFLLHAVLHNDKAEQGIPLALSRGADPNSVLFRLVQGSGHWGREVCLKLDLLLKGKANVRLTHKDGWNLLHEAIWVGPTSYRLIHKLLQAGANWDRYSERELEWNVLGHHSTIDIKACRPIQLLYLQASQFPQRNTENLIRLLLDWGRLHGKSED